MRNPPASALATASGGARSYRLGPGLPAFPAALRLPVLALLFCLPFLLGACSPTYNWREVRVDPGGFLVWMPGKPEQLTRTLPLGDATRTMHMTGARVGPLSFTITVVELGDEGGDSGAQALALMEQAMLRNIGGRVLERGEVALTAAASAPGPSAGASGMRVLALRAQGQAQGRSLMMWARFFRFQAFAVQAVVLGGEADTDKAETFLGSLRLPP